MIPKDVSMIRGSVMPSAKHHHLTNSATVIDCAVIAGSSEPEILTKLAG
jgi:hypothetical protein